MKKVALSLLALAVVGVSAFADAPKWDPKVTTGLTGNASVTLGYDLDYGVLAASNGTNVQLIIDLISGGDAVTSSDKDVWGEIKVKTDGDPYRLKYDDSNDKDFGVVSQANITGNNFFNLQVDYAKIHFGKNAYLSVKDHGTQLSYTNYPDLAYTAWKRSGQYGATETMVFGAALADRGIANGGGAEFGMTVPDVASVTLDAGSTEAWVGAGPNTNKTNLAVKGEVSLLAVPNVTLVAGADYTTKADVDQAVGGKVGYKLMMGEKAYVKPYAGVTMTKAAGKGDYLPVLLGGAIYALDGKAKAFDNYDMALDKDWGAYPGVAVAFTSISKTLAGTSKDKIWMNVSANSGALVADTTVVGAFEILDINADKKNSVMSLGASTKVVNGDVTITPKSTVNYENDAAVDKTYAYLKGTADITGVIPFVTFTVNYESNDLMGKAAGTLDKKMGKFEFTTKVNF